MKIIDLKSERPGKYGIESKLICKDNKSRWCYCSGNCYYYVEIEIKAKELIIDYKTKQINLF